MPWGASERMARFTTPFGFHSTAAEVVTGVDLAGKRAVITGGAAGIGIEAARALSIAGAAVTLAVRRRRSGGRRRETSSISLVGTQLTRSIPVTPNACGTSPSS
jgi:NADPH-dependent 2,4-dienoyl-CoA reductase/sulfur reductase-like enzyme